jgi:hypothetical protein
MPSDLHPGISGLLGACPAWLSIALAAIAAIAAAWILLKLLKWGLWVALIALLAAGAYIVLRDVLR